jgi:hypothetical protein
MAKKRKKKDDENRSQIVTSPKNLSQIVITPSLKSQIATTKDLSKIRTLPYAFTRNGIGMLSSVLGSDTAVAMNIRIMRAFTARTDIWYRLRMGCVGVIEIDMLNLKYYGGSPMKK